MRATHPPPADRPAQTRPCGSSPRLATLAHGEGWRVIDYTCHAGPNDAPFEERHEEVSIAAVVAGSFQYRATAGEALLYPGAFLLGNAGDCFQCSHEHGTGDRSIAFLFAPALFQEIAAATAGTSRFRFPAAMLPATRRLTVPAVALAHAARAEGAAGLGEAAIGLAESVLEALSGTAKSPASALPRDLRRVSSVLRHIEAHAAAPLNLDALAGVAAMSKYHFLRTFRRIAGVTPYEFLLGVRMRRAALALGTTPAPVTTIALDAGFGDLSTFHGRFREVFGTTPAAYRARIQGQRVAETGG
jgi:AraC family transcriptional regulator